MKLTSGSTGLPKAVLATEANLVADVQHIVEAMGIRPTDVQLAATPLSHAYALGNLVLPVLWQGTAMVLRDGFVPHRLVDDVSTLSRAGVAGRAVHVRARAAASAGGRFAVLSRAAHLGGCPARLRRPAAFLRALRAEGAFLLRHERDRRHLRLTTPHTVGPGPTVGRPMPGVTVTLRRIEGADERRGLRVHVAGDAVARRLRRRSTPTAAAASTSRGISPGISARSMLPDRSC